MRYKEATVLMETYNKEPRYWKVWVTISTNLGPFTASTLIAKALANEFTLKWRQWLLDEAWEEFNNYNS